MASAALQFDPAAHTYEVMGRRLPSVTQVLRILNNWGGIPAATLEAARAAGAQPRSFELRRDVIGCQFESLASIASPLEIV